MWCLKLDNVYIWTLLTPFMIADRIEQVRKVKLHHMFRINLSVFISAVCAIEYIFDELPWWCGLGDVMRIVRYPLYSKCVMALKCIFHDMQNVQKDANNLNSLHCFINILYLCDARFTCEKWNSCALWARLTSEHELMRETRRDRPLIHLFRTHMFDMIFSREFMFRFTVQPCPWASNMLHEYGFPYFAKCIFYKFCCYRTFHFIFFFKNIYLINSFPFW